jgi:hypothetical protein
VVLAYISRQAFYPDIYAGKPRKATEISSEVRVSYGGDYEELFAMW